MAAPSSNGQLIPGLSLIVGGALWGLFWIPIRQIGELGLTGAWPGLLVYMVLASVLIPWILLSGQLATQLRGNWTMLVLGGLFTGAAFTLYTISLYLTDVIRVILLFYITPVWGTLLGMIFLGERLTVYRVLALVLGFAGLFTVLGIGVRFPWPSNIGDWMALVSGACWAAGSLCLFKSEAKGTLIQITVFIVGSLIISSLAIAFGGPVFQGPEIWPDWKALAPVVLFTVLLLAPMLYLTIWPVSKLSPGRVGLLLMSEVLVGVLSAAWLSGEPFGPREVIGALLIASAGIVEILSPQSYPTLET